MWDSYVSDGVREGLSRLPAFDDISEGYLVFLGSISLCSPACILGGKSGQDVLSSRQCEHLRARKATVSFPTMLYETFG